MFHLKKFTARCFQVLAFGIIHLATVSCQAQLPVRLALETHQPAVKMPADFLGLSFEMQRVLADTNGNYFFSPTNRALIATFRTLGIKNLRVGGNTADRPTVPTPSRADVDHLFAFAKEADVKVIYTLRLNHGDIESVVKMADYISRHYKKQLDSFAIGNEPNVFSTNYEFYISEWKRYAAAITGPTNVPDAMFCGPGVSPGHEKWSARFAADLAGDRHVAFISQHDYPGGDARKVTNAVAACDRILAPEMDEHYAKFTANFLPAVHSNGFTCRFEEANSFYDGGALDVSDTFASALWALNFQWWLAAHGVSGINFHTGDKVAARDENKPCLYATFWTSARGYNVHPIGYAEKMFALGCRGILMDVAIENAHGLNMAAYAVDDNKNFFITILNREHGPAARAAQIKLATGVPFNSGRIMFLTTSTGDVSTKTGITLGDATIGDDATWTGKWTSLPQADASGDFTFTLPAASAALINFSAQ